jgi:signal transduction histidine kinase
MSNDRLEISGPDRRTPVRSPMARAVFATICVPLALTVGVVALPFGSEAAQNGRQLLLFLAVVACSAFGGVMSGLLGTILAALGAVWLWRYGGPVRGLGYADSGLLAAEGVAVSLIGWALDSARTRARRQEADVRKLQRQILEVGEEERQRIGHDLHDGLGQQMTAISLFSESLAQQAASGRQPTEADVERITKLASDAVRHTRELARNLSPLTLEHEGFVAAMEELAETAGTLFGITCQWDFAGEALPLDPKRALHLYRIVQEAISNSVKHGKARRVRIGALVDNGDLTLIVTDDGSGLSRKTISNPGLGLRIMAYRARMVGAQLIAERAGDAGGTIVRCTCRLDAVESPGAAPRS